MRRVLWSSFAALILLGLSAGAAPVQANMDPEIRGGLYTGAEEGFLGAGLLTNLAPTWYFNPNLEWVFTEGDYVTVNADVHKDLNMGSGPAVWLGAGPALVFANTNDPDLNSQSDSDVDFGLNLFGGLGAQHGSMRPFGQMKYMISDENQLSMAVGLRF